MIVKNLLNFFILGLSSLACAQPTSILAPPEVDKRVELMAITFRLAGAGEYSSKRFPKYVERIEKHFKAKEGHPIVAFIQDTLREQLSIGYDAVMQMAIRVSSPPELKPLIPFEEQIPEERWNVPAAYRYLELLKDFYQQADCEGFFAQNEALYALASQRFGEVYQELDIPWYQDFYGEAPKGEFRIVNGLGNGGGNYGPSVQKPDGREVIYAIMGTWSVDSLGDPVYQVKSYFPTLLHEFNHSFVNHIVEKYHGSLKASGKKIFKPLKSQMERQAYQSWETMYAEAVVRAGVIKYLKDHNYEESFVKNALNREINRGFLWTKELVDELDRYDQNRDQYPSLESFMPELLGFFERTAENMDKYLQELDQKRPKVVAVLPQLDSQKALSPQIKTLEIAFDRPLRGTGYSINYGNKGEEAYPKIEKVRYSDDNKTVLIDVNLEPNREYQFVLTGWSFVSEDGISIEDYEVSFRTQP